MIFEDFRRRRREKLVQEAAIRNGLGHVIPTSRAKEQVLPTHNNVSINIAGTGTPGEMTSVQSWRNRRGGPNAGPNAEPQLNSVTGAAVNNEPHRGGGPGGPGMIRRIRIGFLKYLLMMVKVYKGMGRDIEHKFRHPPSGFSTILLVITTVALLFAFIGVTSWILNLFIQWGFGEWSAFRSMLISLTILHFPLFRKQFYLTRM